MIQNKIDQLIVEFNELGLESFNQNIAVKQQELNALLMRRSELLKTEGMIVEEISFLEKMIIKLDELEKENE